MNKLELAKSLAAKAQAIVDGAKASDREPSPEEMAQVKGLVDDANTARMEHATEEGNLKTIRDLEALHSIDPATARVEAAKASTSMGARITDALATQLKGLAPNGRLPDGARVHTDAVHFNGIRDIFGRKDIFAVDDADRGRGLLREQHLGLVDQDFWRRELTLRNICRTIPAGSDTITYVRTATTTNNAAIVAEAQGTAAGTASGDVVGTKPQSDMTFEEVTDTTKTIAHWMPLTRKALGSIPQLEGIADSFLRYGLEEELEDQILNGDGTGNNFDGILNVSGTQAQAFTTDIFVTLRKAKTLARVNGRARNLSIVLNPEDDEMIDLERDGEDRFHAGGPFATPALNPLWGMPRIVTEAIDPGTAVVGDFGFAVVYDGESADVVITDSHADFFIRNLLAMRAELVAGFGVHRPQALVIVDTAA